jgi:hypothetical protein
VTLKSIQVEFHAEWGRSFRHFSGWVYYMVSGDDYKFYEIIPEKKDHKLLATIPRERVKEIKEKILL